jgi:hypothetical protein
LEVEKPLGVEAQDCWADWAEARLVLEPLGRELELEVVLADFWVIWEEVQLAQVERVVQVV